MADNFERFDTNLDSPGKNAFTVTPSNADDLAVYSRAIYVGNTGNVNVIMAGDATNTLFVGVPSGSTLNVRVKKVWVTGTTATNIVAIY
jgi:hypothetical protein